LCNYNIRVWDPRDKLAVVEKTLLGLFFDVVQVQLLPLVAEQELVATWVEF
jgi:hypothetical protein